MAAMMEAHPEYDHQQQEENMQEEAEVSIINAGLEWIGLTASAHTEGVRLTLARRILIFLCTLHLSYLDSSTDQCLLSNFGYASRPWHCCK